MILWLGLSWYWLLLIESILLFILVINEHETAATISIFIFAMLVHFFTNINVIVFLKTHWHVGLELSVIYAAIGVGWSLAKWYFYVRDKKTQYIALVEKLKKDEIENQRRHEEQEQFLKQRSLERGQKYTPSEAHKLDFPREIENRLGEIPPLARRHKGEIVSWISYWPISVVWTLLDDFMKKLFNEIYNLFAGVFQRISNSQFKDIQPNGDT